MYSMVWTQMKLSLPLGSQSLAWEGTAAARGGSAGQAQHVGAGGDDGQPHQGPAQLAAPPLCDGSFYLGQGVALGHPGAVRGFHCTSAGGN